MEIYRIIVETFHRKTYKCEPHGVTKQSHLDSSSGDHVSVPNFIPIHAAVSNFSWKAKNINQLVALKSGDHQNFTTIRQIVLVWQTDQCCHATMADTILNCTHEMTQQRYLTLLWPWLKLHPSVENRDLTSCQGFTLIYSSSLATTRSWVKQQHWLGVGVMDVGWFFQQRYWEIFISQQTKQASCPSHCNPVLSSSSSFYFFIALLSIPFPLLCSFLLFSPLSSVSPLHLLGSRKV